MDWSNERYVRLYVRDTHDLIACGWEGRFVLYELLRKVDRAGVLDHGGDIDVLPELLRIPADVFERGLAKLKRRKVVRLTATAIVIPNYLEAQEAPQSDAQRMRESRARRREYALHEDVPEVRQMVLGVTERNGSVASGHSVPSRAVPSRTDLDLPPTPSHPGPDARAHDPRVPDPGPAAGGGGGGVDRSSTSGAGAGEGVSRATSLLVRNFYAALGRTSDPAAWEKLVGELLAEGWTRIELDAAAQTAALDWAEDPERCDRAELDWVLKPKAKRKEGGRTLGQWLARAEDRWRSETDPPRTGPPPWSRKEQQRPKNGVHVEAGAA